jgi:hypothetical protein
MKKYIILVVILVVGSFYLGKSNGKTNQTLEYGETGLPKNCRAIITKNLEEYALKKYSAEEVLDSISRNCGRYGYSWDN